MLRFKTLTCPTAICGNPAIRVEPGIISDKGRDLICQRISAADLIERVSEVFIKAKGGGGLQRDKLLASGWEPIE